VGRPCQLAAGIDRGLVESGVLDRNRREARQLDEHGFVRGAELGAVEAVGQLDEAEVLTVRADQRRRQPCRPGTAHRARRRAAAGSRPVVVIARVGQLGSAEPERAIGAADAGMGTPVGWRDEVVRGARVGVGGGDDGLARAGLE
jgi:hypothetical protein